MNRRISQHEASAVASTLKSSSSVRLTRIHTLALNVSVLLLILQHYKPFNRRWRCYAYLFLVENRRSLQTPDAQTLTALTPNKCVNYQGEEQKERRTLQQKHKEAPLHTALCPHRNGALTASTMIPFSYRLLAGLLQAHLRLSRGQPSPDWIRSPDAVSGRTRRGLASPRRCPGLQKEAPMRAFQRRRYHLS